MVYKGQNILVLGAGISGVGAARALCHAGAKVTLSDVHPLSAELTSALTAMGIRCVFGPQDSSLLANIRQAVVSPGIALDTPIVRMAAEANIPLVAELEVAYQLADAPIYAITGTNGKTTTTTLLGSMCDAAGREHVVGGNIGSALSEDVATVSEDGVVIAEVSSFQLETVHAFRPRVAAILNITPDHFERHGSMESYVAAKSRIFENQTADDVLILNRHDAYCRALAERAKSRIYWVGTDAAQDEGGYVRDGRLCLRIDGKEIPLVAVEELQIHGAHNWLNALTAALMAYLAGVPVRVMQGVLRVFSGLPHRVERVDVINGVTYYDDSKATNPDATIKALEECGGRTIWIAGGHDKQTSIEELMAAAEQSVQGAVFLGAAAARFATQADAAGLTQYVMADSMEDAVMKAAELAADSRADVVLFSPACSSFDMYRNYRERGRDFKRCVRQLDTVKS